MSRSKLIALLFALVTIVYVVAFAYSESTKPAPMIWNITSISIRAAAEVSPTDNETVWIDTSTGRTWKQLAYRGELENSNTDVKTAVENLGTWVELPPENYSHLNAGVYQFNNRYYVIWVGTSRTREINPLWTKACEQKQAFIFAGVLLAFGWAGVGTHSLNGGRRVKVLNAVTLTVAILIVAFLVEDIYRLQKEYEIVSAPLDMGIRMSYEEYHWIMERLQEIQAMTHQRIMGLAVVVIATTMALLFLNKRKVFKEKHAVKPELNTLEACSPPSPK